MVRTITNGTITSYKTGEIYEFPNAKLFIKRFLKILHMSLEDNTSVKGFLPLSENYIGEIDPEHLFDFPDDPSVNQDHSGKIKQSKDSLYINLLYALRYGRTGEVLHTEDFSSLDKDMLIELFSIKKQIEFDFVNPRFIDKLYLINDIVIPNGYFLKVTSFKKSLGILT